MELGEGLDLLGNLIATLKQYASKLPERVPLAAVPGGIKPTPESSSRSASPSRAQAPTSVFAKTSAMLPKSSADRAWLNCAQADSLRADDVRV